MIAFGVVKPGSTLRIPFDSFAAATGASSALSSFAVGDILVYKDGNTTARASTTGYTATTTFSSITGINEAVIDLSSDATADFFKAGSNYVVVISPVTIDGQTVAFVAATFTIGYPQALLNTSIATLASQTSFTLTTGPAEDDALNGMWIVVHDKASAVQMTWAVILDYTGSTKTVTLAASPAATFTIAAGDNAAVMELAPLQPTVIGRYLDVSAGGEAGIDWANIGSPTTAQNLSATNIDVDQVVASVTGAVGSVTGAVGSVTGAVGSVTGNVGGNVTGSVGSVVGNVGGNVTGSAGSVVGAVGSVTGNVGGNVTGSVGSVASGGIAAASFAAGAIDAAAIAPNAIGSSEIADGAITAAKIADAAIDAATFATGAIDAAALAADAGTEIGTAVWASAARTLTALDEDSTTIDLDASIRGAVGMASANLDTQLAALPTAGEIWDEDATGHQTQGTFGQAIGDPGADSDSIWALANTIKAKTDSLTFTVANKVDSNIKSVNDVTVTGDGQSGTEWGP